MPVSMKKKAVREDDADKEAFVVSFTNGAKNQLEDLQHYFQLEQPLKVIELGISFLQRLKEAEEKKEQEKEHDAPESSTAL